MGKMERLGAAVRQRCDLTACFPAWRVEEQGSIQGVSETGMMWLLQAGIKKKSKLTPGYLCSSMLCRGVSRNGDKYLHSSALSLLSTLSALKQAIILMLCISTLAAHVLPWQCTKGVSTFLLELHIKWGMPTPPLTLLWNEIGLCLRRTQIWCQHFIRLLAKGSIRGQDLVLQPNGHYKANKLHTTDSCYPTAFRWGRRRANIPHGGARPSPELPPPLGGTEHKKCCGFSMPHPCPIPLCFRAVSQLTNKQCCAEEGTEPLLYTVGLPSIQALCCSHCSALGLRQTKGTSLSSLWPQRFLRKGVQGMKGGVRTAQACSSICPKPSQN